MTNQTSLCSAAAIVFAAAALNPGWARAAEDTGRFYASLRLGPSLVQDMDFAQRTTANLALNPEAGFALGGALGYGVTKSLRVELDLGYGRNTLTGSFQQNVQVFIGCGELPSSPCLNPDVDGDVATIGGFAMVYYDPPVEGRLKPFIGAGVGFVSVALDVGTGARMNNGTLSRYDIIDSSDSRLGYRGTLGVAYDLGGVELMLGYSYAMTDRLEMPGKGTYVSFTFDQRATSHAINAGARYRF